MPKSIKYNTIIPYVSASRFQSYQDTFSCNDDAEYYGAYIWSQHAAASFYPLLQNLEVTLRNAIDAEAKRRFGQYWWDNIGFNGNRNLKGHQDNNCKFFDSIRGAERKLTSAWKRKERLRLGLPPTAPVPTPTPTWPHDKIIAATDFSAWEFILVDAFSTNDRNLRQQFLFPQSMGKIFKNYSSISNKPNQARRDLLDLIQEVREYRNRLFHHEPLWIKSPTVTNDRTAIDTVRKKINRAEKILFAINTKKHELLDKVGVFRHVRRVCSVDELYIYTYSSPELLLTSKKKRNLRKLTTQVNKAEKTLTFDYGEHTYALHKVR
ncbi:Abi family protein [Vibrio parahaemolyticus]|uniref:Abi family protein n=1 Tax=Vibrio harveyi group TaxID=717610 RepID=UPI00112499D0|nr:Abi family protein [Vibrio parahaemolyticus]EGQ8084649.1 hypothetical protein [Vibrio parahaemolyticus]EKD4049925.1 Abi family protein [Vibrio parahaemolyticus]TOM29998.1 hypothetical protein CGH78_24680 [Vibrio parahaemolyticus]